MHLFLEMFLIKMAELIALEIQRLKEWLQLRLDTLQFHSCAHGITWPVEKVVHPSGDDIDICPVCHEVPRHPLWTPCNHMFCEKCITEGFRLCINLDYDQFNELTVPCPMCRQRFTVQQLRYPTTADSARFYDKLILHCSNTDCDFVGFYAQVLGHEPLCPKRPVNCAAPRCLKILSADKMIEHYKSCMHREAVCKTCTMRYFPNRTTPHNCVASLLEHVNRLEFSEQAQNTHEAHLFCQNPPLRSVRPDKQKTSFLNLAYQGNEQQEKSGSTKSARTATSWIP